MVDWPNRATCDMAVIQNWLDYGYPRVEGENDLLPVGGWAIVTGQASGIVVVDVDGLEGQNNLREFSKRRGCIPQTTVQMTPGGGFHFLFKVWGVVKNRTGVLPKVDVRAEHGYIAAAPSFHPNGKPYEWLPGAGLDDLPLAECPDFLKILIDGGKAPDLLPLKGGEGEAIPEGQRNATLASMAGTMRRRGMGEGAIVAALLETNRAQCRPPLPEGEVRKIASSIGGKPVGEPTEKRRNRPFVADVFTKIEDDPEPIEHIGGLFPRGDVTVFFGKPGCGKTIFLDCFTRQLSEGGAILDGIFGEDEPPRKVLFLEGDATMKLFATRKCAFHWGGDTTKLKHVFTRELLKNQRYVWDIGTLDGVGFLRDLLENERPDLVVIDTLQGFHLLDENDAGQMKGLFLRLVELATEFNTAIVVVHHARKGNPKFKTERLSIEDAQGSNIFLREAGAVVTLEKMDVGGKTLHVISRLKSWAKKTQDAWFGFEIIEGGFYDKHQKLTFELFPATGATKSDALRRGILGLADWFTRDDIKNAFPDYGEPLVKKILHELTDAGLLETEGQKRGVKYRMKKSE
jgi:hypothetical protein